MELNLWIQTNVQINKKKFLLSEHQTPKSRRKNVEGLKSGFHSCHGEFNIFFKIGELYLVLRNIISLV